MIAASIKYRLCRSLSLRNSKLNCPKTFHRYNTHVKFRYIQLIVEGSSEVFQLQLLSLAKKSRTFQDLPLKFPGLSRTKPIFQDFPGPGNFTKKNPGLSRRRVNPDNRTVAIVRRILLTCSYRLLLFTQQAFYGKINNDCSRSVSRLH